MMDWAEELKLSIRKKTARKGRRRSKSRDPIDGGGSTTANTSSAAATSTSTTNTTKQFAGNEIGIDILLDLQRTNSTAAAVSNEEPEAAKRQPPVRRISGGWADVGILKSSKSKKGASFEDERFQSVSIAKPLVGSPPPRDDIPTIPDMDDLKDEVLLNEIVEPPTASSTRPSTLSEINADLLNQQAFSSLEGTINLTALTRCLKLPKTLDEPDEVWHWDKLFTDVIAEIHADQQTFTSGQQKEIGPDLF